MGGASHFGRQNQQPAGGIHQLGGAGGLVQNYDQNAGTYTLSGSPDVIRGPGAPYQATSYAPPRQFSSGYGGYGSYGFGGYNPYGGYGQQGMFGGYSPYGGYGQGMFNRFGGYGGYQNYNQMARGMAYQPYQSPYGMSYGGHVYGGWSPSAMQRPLQPANLADAGQQAMQTLPAGVAPPTTYGQTQRYATMNPSAPAYLYNEENR